MRLRSFFASLFPLLCLAAACDDDPPPRPPVTEDGYAGPGSPGGGSGGTDGGTTPDGGGDAGSCTDLPITGVEIAQQVVTGDPPAGTGGTLLDGTYDLTDATLYGGATAVPGPSGATYQASIRITGATFERHSRFRNSGGAVIENIVSGTISVAASSVIALSCPVAVQEQITYTASNNTLVLSNLITKEALGFTRRP